MRTLKNYILILSLTVLAACGEKPAESDSYNTDAATPAKFDPVKSGLKPLNEFLNTKQNTISILYGNEVAYNALKAKPATLPNGCLLTLVTWQRKTDPHWFGANIPGKLLSLETVKTSEADSKITSSYQKLTGDAMAGDPDTTQNGARKNFILAQRPAVMP